MFRSTRSGTSWNRWNTLEQMEQPGTKMRKAFLMKVNPDAHDEYERRHRPIWDELAEVLKRHGVSNYSIFLEPSTSQLFGYVEIESDEGWAAIAETDECKRWWAFMKDIMPTNADSSPVSLELREVFHLD